MNRLNQGSELQQTLLKRPIDYQHTLLGTLAFIELKSVTKNLAGSKHKILDFSANLPKLKKIVNFLLCTKFMGPKRAQNLRFFYDS